MPDPYTNEYFEEPEQYCDIIMKGGITSGVIYPLALCELAEKYRFRSVGGASAGAIAAAFAAAAEYDRKGGGFLRLSETSAELAQKLSDEDIDYPKAVNIDLLLALTQESVNRYHKDLKDGGMLLVDEEAAKELPEGDFQVYTLPIIGIARDNVCKALVANIVALGIITELAGVVSHEAVEAAILARVPKGTEDLNLRAFKAGVEAAKELKA